MNVDVRGKDLTLGEATKRYIRRKFAKLQRYWPAITRVEVLCSLEPTRAVESRFRVAANVFADGPTLFGEERAGDLLVAADGLAEKLERQVRRTKGQLTDRRRGAAIWPEEPRPAIEPATILILAEEKEADAGVPDSFGDLPNLLDWPVVGPNEKEVGVVTGLYVHEEQGEIAALLVETSEREFTVPIAEIEVNQDQRQVRVRRNLTQIPRPPADLQGLETPLRSFLEHYDVSEATIQRLETYGVRTMTDLRTRVEEGRLEALLGEEQRQALSEITRLIAEQT